MYTGENMVCSNNYKHSEPKLCVNGCGFYGSSSTKNLCSKCYSEEQVISATAAFDKLAIKNEVEVAVVPPAKMVRVYKGQDKCWTCKRRVRLANGFKCRCGFLFCGSHRYPEVHRCSFDYKELGEYEIAKANPLAKADKMAGRI